MLNWHLVLSLITAHILADFLLQTDEQAAQKSRPTVLLRHAAVAAVLSYLLAGRLGLWIVPLVIFVSHAVIDLVKSRFRRNTLTGLALDQLAHVLVIFLLVAWYSQAAPAGISAWVELFELWYDRMLVLVSGFVLTTHTGAVVVRIAMEPYVRQMDHQVQKAEEEGAPTVRGLQEGARSSASWRGLWSFCSSWSGSRLVLGS